MSKKEEWCLGISKDEKEFDKEKLIKRVDNAHKNINVRKSYRVRSHKQKIFNYTKRSRRKKSEMVLMF